MTDPLVFLREFAYDRAEQVVGVPGGFAALSPRRFPNSHDHNLLWIFEPTDPAAVIAAADDVLGALPHQQVETTAGVLTGELTAALLDAGYEREDLLVMTSVRPPDTDRPPGDGVVDLDLDARIAMADRVWVEDGSEPQAAVRRELAERARTATTGAQCTFLAVTDDDGAVQASCDLFVRGGTAQVEEVSTLQQFRGRGHASRLVRAAVDRARADDPARSVFLVAEADDWPKQLYARLGFETTDRYTVWGRGRVSGP